MYQKQKAMIITTSKGAKFNTELPAKSNLFKVIKDNRGNTEMDSLRITGRTTQVMEFMKPMTMIEVEHSFGTDEVSEDYIWQ